MEITQVCAACGGERGHWWHKRGEHPQWVTCPQCKGKGRTTTPSTQTREERRFDLIKAVATGALASEKPDQQFPNDKEAARGIISQADAILARLDAEKEPDDAS